MPLPCNVGYSLGSLATLGCAQLCRTSGLSLWVVRAEHSRSGFAIMHAQQPQQAVVS